MLGNTWNTVIFSCVAALITNVQGYHSRQVILQEARTNVKVPVTLGVMSRCPDAILCESVFDEVVKHTIDKIDLSLTFIGRYEAV